MAKKKWPFKDPDELLDYEIKWGERLGTDTIATSTWTIVTTGSLTKTSQSDDAQNTIVWLSGGLIGENYEILNRIVTDGGRTMDQTVFLKIKAK